MRTAFLLLALAVAVQVRAETPAPVYSIDFGDVDHSVSNRSVGSFVGSLPPRMGENFTPWKAVRATATAADDPSGRRFLRIENASSTSAQFMCIGCQRIRIPGVYRIVLSGRTLGCGLEFAFRDMGAPYAEHWKGSLDSPEWKRFESFVRLQGRPTGELVLMLYPGTGVTDLESLKIYASSEEELASRIRRPAADVRLLARNDGFPFGLPVGWNVGTHGAAPDSVTVEGDDLVVASAREMELYTAPFGVRSPGRPHGLELSCESDGEWRVEVCSDCNRWQPLATGKVLAGSVRVQFSPPRDAEALCGRLVGRGRLRIRSFCAYEGASRPTADEDEQSSVALGAGKGDVASEARIHFEDEGATFRWRVFGVRSGDCLKYQVSDVYGERVLVGETDASASCGECAYLGRGDVLLGAFLVEAWIERSGKRVSPVSEIQLVRVPRPVHWGADAPDSPFGGHFLPRPETVRTMKALGVNWVRLHDAGTELSGWWNLERERGKWTFDDESIAAYRRAHVKILAQLGTAPAWATHYGDLGCRQMGYFERYLRPTNAVDFLNYVTTFATRNKASIDEYFLWNEPWGRWWKYAADARYFKDVPAGVAYGQLQQDVYAALKRVDPRLRLCGYNSIAGYDGFLWTHEVDQSGAFGSCDVIDYHFYADIMSLRLANEPKSSDLPLKPLRDRKADLGSKRIYMTEGNCGQRGHMSGLLRQTVPYAPETAEEMAQIADRLCRYVVGLLAERVDRVFLYSSHTYSSLVRAPTFPALLGADGFPHPSAAAFAHMARQLEGLRHESTKRVFSCGLACRFSGVRGDCVVYANLTPDEAKSLAAIRPLTDLWGNPFGRRNFTAGTLLYESVDRKGR